MIEITYTPNDIISEITRTLQVFKPDNVLFEVRAVGSKNYSGYFTDTDKLTKAINQYKDITWYFIMNTIDSDCYNRSQRDCITYSKTTTSDSDITNREWLLIDCDPIRKSGMSASDEEKQHALNTLSAVYDFLQERGFYEPVIADSGNGYHLLYQIDTPNTKENTDTIKSFLSLLDMRFTDEYVKIDTAVFNPARITKLYGTYARKGANTPERPHRQSHIMSVPDQIAVTDMSLIQSVADMLPKPVKPEKKSYNGKQSKFDLQEFIQKHGIAVSKETANGNCTKFLLEECPFNSEHKAPDSALFLYNDGALGFKCFHDSCSNNHWQEFRTHYEPEAYEKRSVTPINHVIISNDGDTVEINVEAISTWEDITDENILADILSCKDKVKLACDEAVLLDIARKLGRVNDFKTIMKAVKSKIATERREIYLEKNPNGLHFTDPPIQLETDKYRGDNSGVYLYGDCIIPQPLLITKLFEDVESGDVKAEIAFRDKGQWKPHTVLRGVIANRNKIIDLANVGLAVTTDNANEIVNYLQELQTENAIPTQKSVSHMGYVGKKFVPFDSGLIYIGDTAYTDIYNSVHSKGELENWVNLYREVRNDSLAARVSVASSFASPLLYVFGKPSYFTHLWGDSGTGKTVCLCLACSVWGDPDGYMYTLNATSVGLERTAYFFHHLPLVLDELQTVRNDDISKIIYLLSQGQGRTRGTGKGVDTVLKWRNSFITSGEQPLTKSNSNTGEINRIIDIPVVGQVFNDPTAVYNTCANNYGHAGRYFIEHITEYNPREILTYWETLLNQHNSDISGKHKMSLAVILTADELVNRMLFKMNEVEARTDTTEFYMKLSSIMISTAESDLATRAYEFLVGWVVQNESKFKPDDREVWGRFSAGHTTVFIMKNALEKALIDNGFNYTAVKKALAERKYSVLSENVKKNEYTKAFKINNTTVRGIELLLPV
jgi:Superfamily II helicase and inactivated derivatives